MQYVLFCMILNFFFMPEHQWENTRNFVRFLFSTCVKILNGKKKKTHQSITKHGYCIWYKCKKVSFNSRRTWSCWSGSRKELQGWPEGSNTSGMGAGWERYSAWRIQGSGVALQLPSRTWRRSTEKLRSECVKHRGRTCLLKIPDTSYE